MKKKSLLVFLICFLSISIQSCRKKQPSYLKYQIELGSLDHLPISMDEFISLAPLGFMSPPGHVFPNDHMGFYYVKEIVPVTIYSPGNLHIIEIRGNTYNPGQPGATSDYALTFGAYGRSALILGHISQLSPKLIAAFGDYSGCTQYPVGTGIVKACRKEVSIDVASGEIIGYSNLVQGQQALDMGMYLINNEPVSPLDYFNDTIKKQLESRLMGSPNAEFDGELRTALPLAGEINQDVLGTLQGIWLQKGFPKQPESNHIAFAKNYIHPEQLRISFGSSVPVFGPGLWKFDQQNQGIVNRAFLDVKPDEQTYCYDPLYLSWSPNDPSFGTFPNNSFIVKLEDSKTLSLEVRDCNCATNLPYTFTAAKKTYVRQ